MQQVVKDVPAVARRTQKQFEPLSTLRVPLWIAAAYMLLTTNADPDLFGHLRFGLDHLHLGHLSSADPYSFTSDRPWVNHEWLAELLSAAAYSVAGTAGLAVMKGVVAVATLLLIMRAVKHTPPLWRWPSALLAALGAIPIFLTVRPQNWTLLFLTLTCTILTGRWKRRYWLPLIFLLWANMHGGWLVGMGVLGVWCAVELAVAADDRPPVWVSVAIPIACLLATLINPYGWHLWEFLAQTVRLTRADITEWQPLWRGPAGSMIHWAATIAWSGLAIRYAERKNLKAIAASAILAYGSMRVLRLVPLFIPSVVLLLTPGLKAATAGERQAPPRAKTLVDVVFACAGLVIVGWPIAPGCIHLTGWWLPDASVAKAVTAADVRGRMVTWFNWGEYAIWHFGPNVRVSIDGRRETVYTERVLEEQRHIAYGEPDALKRLQTESPEYVWVPQGHTDRTKPWLASHGYRIDVDTPVSFLAVRQDLAPVAAVSSMSAPCFPGP